MAGIGLAVLLAGATSARAGVTQISGSLGDTLDNVVGAGNSAQLVGDATTFWLNGTFISDVDLNGYTFTINSGGGNAQDYEGAISGPGTLGIVGNGVGSWPTDPELSGTTANTMSGISMTCGDLVLNKTPGVDALAGSIIVNAPYGGYIAKIELAASNQINDASTIDSTASSTDPTYPGTFILKLNGFTERIATLSINTGHVVDTGAGGVLYVNELYVDGVQQPHVPKAASLGDGFVLGSGYIDVGNSGPPVFTDPPSVPATPTPADAAADVNPAYLTTLDWADCLRATSYDVYFWLASDTKPATPTATVSSSEYTLPAQVLSLTDYKWQVVAQNAIGPTPGPEWSFSTIDRMALCGNMGDTLDNVVGAGPAYLTCDATTFWLNGTFYADVQLNGHTFTINTGGGNAQDYEGAISGPGTVGIVGNGVAAYGNDPVLGGTTANTMSGVSMECGNLVLNKTPGVDALAGPIIVNAPYGGYIAIIELAANDQINDASTIDSTASSTDATYPGTFILRLDAGVTETISGLAINTGHTVDTGDGSVLTLTNLTVGGVIQSPGTYTSGTSAFVTGTGSVVVQAAPAPPAPANPSPADGATGVNPRTFTKLDWADSAGAGVYDVYLWIPASQSKPLTPTAEVSASEYVIPVQSLTTYKWQVVAKNASGSTPGPEWTFTTLDARTFTDLSGTLSSVLDAVVGAGNTGRCVADTTTTWPATTASSDVVINGFTLTLNNGGGNGQVYNGALSGPGTLRIQGSPYATWNPDIELGGTAANSPTAVILDTGALRLNKTAGVDALAGTITVDTASPYVSIIWLLKNNQINDAATIDATTATGSFTLDLNGFSDTIASLSMNTGHTVDTGSGGVLTVTTLTVNGSAIPAGTYAGGSQAQNS